MKLKFTHIVILALAVALLLSTFRCGKGGGDTSKSDTVTVKDIDTLIWIVHDTIPSKPKLIKSEPITDTLFRDSIITKYSSKNCDTIKLERDELLALYTTQNEYYDGFYAMDGKDTLAFISIVDTIAANQILGRKTNTSIWQKQINTTTTHTITKVQVRNQLYIGGELGGNKRDIFSLAGIGLLLKTKKDNLYGVKATMDFNGTVYYSLQYYKKISLRRKN